MKFAIIVLIILGCASIAGIIIGEIYPTNVPGGLQFYLNRLGESKFKIYQTLGVFSPYRSFWYTGILAILSLSLTICTIRRVSVVWNSAFKKSTIKTAHEILDLKFSKDIITKRSTHEINMILRTFFKKKFYKTDIKESEGKTNIFAFKGRFGRFGALIMHTGFLIALLGGLLTSIMGYSLYRWGGVGSIITVPERDFQVRVDSFDILYNERGQVKDYLCGLTVIDEGVEVVQKVIEVNQPLRYNGISFYQSSYRQDARRVKTATLNVYKKDAQNSFAKIILDNDKIVPVEETEFAVRMIDFAGNFLLAGREVISDPSKNTFQNPAVKLKYTEIIYQKGQGGYFHRHEVFTV